LIDFRQSFRIYSAGVEDPVSVGETTDGKWVVELAKNIGEMGVKA
jgi:hypothetical protein